MNEVGYGISEHQAAEHTLPGILKTATGLHINTHSLDKLIRYYSMASYKLPELFPRNNEKQERLFLLLQKAYIDTRYKDNYSISATELQTLKQGILKLIEMIPGI